MRSYIGATYTPNQLVGVFVYAGKNVSAYNSIEGTPVVTIPKDAPIGEIFSYVIRDGVLWWMFYYNNNTPFYIRNSDNVFNNVLLEASGVVSAEQQIIDAEQENQNIGDSIVASISPLVKYGIIAFAVAGVVKFILPDLLKGLKK
jgi:hypothetical protein